MLHHEASRLLPELAAGEIRGVDERRLRRHLDRCEECRTWLETYTLFSQSLGEAGAGQAHPPSDLLARLAVDRELLSAAERESVAEHLESCGNCRREVETGTASLDRDAVPGWRRLVEPGVAVRVAAAAAIALAVGIGFRVDRAPERIGSAPVAAPESEDREISGDVLRGVRVIEAAGSITARELSVEPDAELTLRAGGAVALGDGFSVGDGGRLQIENVVAANGRSRGKEPA